jgi:NADH-quinone oxidoreductase subunit C
MGLTPEGVLARVGVVLPAVTRLPLETMRGQAVVVADPEGIEHVLRTLRDDPELAFDALSDLTAVDYLGRTPRFEVVYQLNALAKGHRLRVKAALAGDAPAISTASGLWRSALWAEREVFDMFGIRFAGHPDLRRILLYPEFEGHPLRKDYPVQQRWPLVPERDPITQPWAPRTVGR